jgi:hypothetical protein
MVACLFVAILYSLFESGLAKIALFGFAKGLLAGGQNQIERCGFWQKNFKNAKVGFFFIPSPAQ